ncbi:MAG: type III-B CRISPR module-associated protein Cmr5 [Victivallaceae bacterium]|nr:type III-B CRISPR module-associated protein Cmr5 [Victivallaceae bacterium]
MKIQNLDQIRAKNALVAAENKMGGKNSGEVVKKVPPMIRENGILGALAFAKDKDKDKESSGDYGKCFEAIIAHLKSVGKTSASSLDAFLNELVDADSAKLRDVTAESMLYLNYLRRFAEKPEKKEE